jgi:hypothetical protein
MVVGWLHYALAQGEGVACGRGGLWVRDNL